MHVKKNLMLWTGALALALPLLFAGSALAAFIDDGAVHTSTNTASYSTWSVPGLAAGASTRPTAVTTTKCLECHQSGGASDKTPYLLGGHKNMVRKTDGLPWGIPGVSATTPKNPALDNVTLDSNGFFTDLWVHEDYPRMPVNWGTASGFAPSSVTMGYCTKAGTALGMSDLPDLAACEAAGIACESPIFGSGNAGYPLGYPTQALCQAAKDPRTGTNDYVWVAPTNMPLYWFWGGAGLEGGPSILAPGARKYSCARCHTTGWTADAAADHNAGHTGALDAKSPYADFGALVDFTAQTIISNATKLLDPNNMGLAAATGTRVLSSWDQWGVQCTRCHVGPSGTASDGNHDTMTTGSTGGDIVALCMTCHRQDSDSSAGPRSLAGTVNTGGTGAAPTTNAAATNVSVYTNKQAQPDGFAHHPDGNEFLNSPHARFTGTWGQIGCPPYAITGYTSVGYSKTNTADPGAPTDCTPGAMDLSGAGNATYNSKFAWAAKVDLGQSDAVAGSCTTCHAVHQPHNENTVGMGGDTAMKATCQDCHAKAGGSTVTPQIATINHPASGGTPLAYANPCEICHQPAGIKHLWRISSDANYTMYGDYTYAAAAQGADPNGAVNPSHLVNDTKGYGAMWIDLDNACGQCHGGGVSQADVVTLGSITGTGTNTTANAQAMALTVDSPTGFASGKLLKIAGAGVGGADFETIIAKVSGNTVYLTYPAVTTVATATVTVTGNPTHNGAPYRTRTELASSAANMHGLQPQASFMVTASTTTNYLVNFDASLTACPGGACTYAWDFGDTNSGTNVTTTHTYGSATPVAVKLTVTDALLSSSVTHTVVPHSVNHAPVALGLRTAITGTSFATPTLVSNNTNSVSFTDASTDADGNVKTVTVSWGDGLVSSVLATGATFTHSYTRAGTYVIIHTVKDTGGRGNTERAVVKIVPPSYSITGTVKNNAGAALSGAMVYLKLNGHTRAIARSAANGSYSFPRVLPGSYTITTVKRGYTFTTPVTVDVTGSATVDITAN